MKTNKIMFALVATILFQSCKNNEQPYDATGVFEAVEVVVSAEQAGRILELNLVEGTELKQNEQVGLIDTVQLYLKARQIGATKMVYSAQIPATETQVATLRQQLSKAEQEVARFESLVKDGAANRKLLDDARSQEAVIRRQIDALKSQLGNSTNSLAAQMNTVDVQKLQIADQLQKCHVVSPINGVVLEKYAQKGEFASVGRALFKVADTNDMFLRAYVTSLQLNKVKVGQKVKVFADYGNDERKEYEGTVTWISPKSEFTPKGVLTDDERADLVYAVKVAVKNDGFVKIGMYGEVKL